MSKILMKAWGRTEPVEIDPDVLEEAAAEDGALVFRDLATNVYRVGQPGSRFVFAPRRLNDGR